MGEVYPLGSRVGVAPRLWDGNGKIELAIGERVMVQRISAEQMQAYRATAQKRRQQRRDRQLARYQLGLQVAQQAAVLLKQEFQVERVALFGSLLSADQVHDRSDVDLAVWGLNEQDYYRAVGRLQSLDAQFAVDLVEVETAPERIRQTIEATGMLL